MARPRILTVCVLGCAPLAVALFSVRATAQQPAVAPATRESLVDLRVAPYLQRSDAPYAAGTSQSNAQLTGNSDSTAYARRAHARLVSGDYKGAVADATHALSLNPIPSENFYSRGRLDADQFEAVFVRGRALNALGDRLGAQNDLTLAENAKLLEGDKLAYQAILGLRYQSVAPGAWFGIPATEGTSPKSTP